MLTTKQKNALLKKLKKVTTPDDLTDLLGFDFNEIDISYRGGGIGFSCGDIADLLDIDEDDLPRKGVEGHLVRHVVLREVVGRVDDGHGGFVVLDEETAGPVDDFIEVA